MVVVTSRRDLAGTEGTLHGCGDDLDTRQQKVLFLRSRHQEVVESSLDA